MRDIDVLALNIDDFVVERAAVKAMLARELPKVRSAFLAAPAALTSIHTGAFDPVAYPQRYRTSP